MSWADEASLRELASTGNYIFDDDEYDDNDRIFVTKNGTEICRNCGSKNIKVSNKGNKYCADLCWTSQA